MTKSHKSSLFLLMGIEIILYDSSPITQKIFFHILYPYRPIVHRIDQTSKLIEKVQYSAPDIIFIDASFSDDIKNQINEKKEQLKNIPIILMAKEDLNQEELKTSVAQDFLKKPIEAGKLRELVNRFIPKTKSNILTKHLQFPSIPDFKEEDSAKQGSELSSKTPTKQGIKPITDTETPNQQEDLSSPAEPKQASHVFPKEKGIKPITDTQIPDQQEDLPSPAEPKQASHVFPKEKGIKPITDTQIPDQQEDLPSPAEPKQASHVFPKEEGIKPITDTQIPDQQEDLPSPAEPKQASHVFPKEEGIKPITNTQISDQQEVDIPLHNEEKKSATDVKILQVPSESEPADIKEDKSEEPEPDLNVLKNQITEEIKQWADRKIKEEVEKQLEHLIKEDSRNTIQTTTEKAVWQVVPELAKQLITKELDKLLKEEENPNDADE